MFFHKKCSIQFQFFLTYLCISIIVIGIFSSFFYYYISDILIERETAAFHTIASSFMTQTDNALRTMDKVSINIGYSNLIKDTINDYFNFTSPTHDEFSSLVGLFVAINGADYQVFHINLYDKQGQVIRVGTTATRSTVNLNALDWIEKADKLKGHKLLSKPYSTSSMSNTSTSSPYFISLYRTYYDKYKKPIGYIETIQKCKTIFNDIISYCKKNTDTISVYVFDAGGALVYPFEPSSFNNDTLYTHYYDIVKNNASLSTYENPLTAKKELVTYETSDYSQWTYICVQPEAIILAPVKSFTHILYIVIAIVFILIILLSYTMSKSLTRPINQLVDTIEQTKLDTLGYMEKDKLHTPFNEFDLLNEAFHSMQTNLKISMDELIETRQQELKSRSLALQSQMNPHFYYNSLSSIMILAENGQCNDVVKLCKNLSHIMRYITKGSANQVLINEEIDYVSKYLYCMKVRYQSSLNYTIDVAPELLDLYVPKLIIQPLVENALKYGINAIPLWQIDITSKVTDTYWEISVADSGPGFSEEALALIQTRIKEADTHIGMPTIEINGMGLLNVYSRWKLYCKTDFIFTYANKENGGSIVTIGRYF
ncbi:sensor histidine kinase [Sporanaerobium hydrogeniformans]|uniref:Sensor histidine kinase n=1 Tax=Sporanaerobium hydrogeniformans TaxID=3072179 RepID=A0AC61DA55_9FIRM|nr:histidine kinase [Sporanaerobium hydrogeniformans]PHV69583.1 sensor histidine kinase [Sporanaerobium hydrogeniformans]